MSHLPSIFPSFFDGLLNKPGDTFIAKVTKSNRHVIKLKKSGIKRSAVRYPSTGTIVETIVHRKNR